LGGGVVAIEDVDILLLGTMVEIGIPQDSDRYESYEWGKGGREGVVGVPVVITGLVSGEG